METLEIQGVTQPKIVFEALLEECEASAPIVNSSLQELSSLSQISNLSLETSKSLSQTLHKLRGSFGFMGFQELCALTKNCEQTFNDSDLPSLKTSLSSLSSELTKLAEDVKKAL